MHFLIFIVYFHCIYYIWQFDLIPWTLNDFKQEVALFSSFLQFYWYFLKLYKAIMIQSIPVNHIRQLDYIGFTFTEGQTMCSIIFLFFPILIDFSTHLQSPTSPVPTNIPYMETGLHDHKLSKCVCDYFAIFPILFWFVLSSEE